MTNFRRNIARYIFVHSTACDSTPAFGEDPGAGNSQSMPLDCKLVSDVNPLNPLPDAAKYAIADRSGGFGDGLRVQSDIALAA